MQRLAVAGLFLLFAGTPYGAPAGDLEAKIATIARVGPQSAGSAAARRACRELGERGPEVLPLLLVAMDTPNIVAANWFRAAYERVVARELAGAHQAIPVAAFRICVRDARRQGRVRRLALALLDRIDPTFKPALLPTLLDDPEFRDDAVAIALTQGDTLEARGDKGAAKLTYERAFQHARNPQQVTAAASKLESLGEKVHIAEHLGFVTAWSLVGPFAAPGMTGFRTPFFPEAAVDRTIPATTADKKAARWVPFETTDPFGTVDLTRVFGPMNEAVGYARAEIESPRSREAQLRASADDCLAVWLNGEKVFGREMWLNGTRFDRFITPVMLKAGRNCLLVKVCQGPHHRDPSVGNAWTFQLRLCSADGEGLPLKQIAAAADQSTASRPKRSPRD